MKHLGPPLPVPRPGGATAPAFTEPRGTGGLRAVLLLLWAGCSFGVLFHARSLSRVIWGWPLNFWIAAQGCVLCFLALAAVYAGYANRLEAQQAQDSEEDGPHDAR